jgi:proline iminopeptidase/2-hydroxymuconate-semialdehyde hydrolase
MKNDDRPWVGARLAAGWQARVRNEWLRGWETHAFDLGDGWTEVVTLGNGEPLLLLPPLPGYKEAWLAVASRLARRHRVVTFDLRTRFSGAPGWDRLVDDLERVADAFAPGRAAVIGHSLGAALAQRWALRHPGRVRALVLSSSFARVTHRPGHLWKRFVEQPLVLAGQRLLPEALAAPLARDCARRGRWVYDQACDDAVLAFVRHGIRNLRIADARTMVRLAFAHDTTAALGALTMPVLLLVGDRETAWARSATAELRRLIPHADAILLTRVGHLHPLSAPAAFTAAIEEWLAAHDT